MARKIFTLCGGGAIALTLMACYGGPPKKALCDEPDTARDGAGQADDAVEAPNPCGERHVDPATGEVDVPTVQRGG